jgi:hypothetical protein
MAWIFDWFGRDNLFGTESNDWIWGFGGNDFISAGGGNDRVSAGSGNDTMIGGLGSDSFNGGSGEDVAIYSGNVQDFQIALGVQPVPADGNVTIKDMAGDQGTDLLTNVERAEFDGYTLYMDGTNNAVIANDDDGIEAVEDVTLAIAADGLTANDFNVDGDTLTITSVQNVAGGTVTLNGDQIEVEGGVGQITFEYTVNDGNGSTDTAMVTVDVVAAPEEPLIVLDA